MSDIKHLQYCVKLGNKQMEDKLFQIQNNEYVEPQYRPQTESDNLSFKQRLQSWK